MSRTEPLWLLAPIPAMVVGMVVATSAGVHWFAFLPNMMALVMGALFTFLIARSAQSFRNVAPEFVPALVCAAIAATLLAVGEQDVQRWMTIGPVNLYAAAVLMPMLLLGFLSPKQATRNFTVLCVLITQCILYKQPDAAQASALVALVLPLLLDKRTVHPGIGIPAVLLLTVIACLTWQQKDPLQPIPHVEGILHLAASKGSLWVTATVIAVAMLLLPFALGATSTRGVGERIAVGLLLYLATAFAVVFVGHFPVPVCGAGAGFMIGWYSMMSVMAAARAPVTTP